MKIHLKSFQDSFIFSPKRYPAMIAGWATGKTMCGILRALSYTELIPDNLGVIFRKEYTDLADSTIKDYEKYTGRKVDSHRDSNFSNGSTIMFRHLEEINNIQNINLGWFLIEQIEELDSDNEFFMLQGRLRRKVEPTKEFKKLGLSERSGFVIGNVGQEWVKNVWKDAPKADYELSEATTFDNADVLPEDYLQSLKDLETLKPEIYRRYVLNDWTVGDDSFILIPIATINDLKGINYADTVTGRVISIDPSMGGDACVMYVLHNNHIIHKEIMYERDTMKIAGQGAILSHKYGISDFVVDSIGIGRGVCDRLTEMNRRVMDFNSSEKSNAPENFYNKRAEAYWHVMERIRDKQIPYPKDDELNRQLSSVKYKVVNSNGCIKLEAKDEIKKRIGRSPDEADAFVMGIWATQFLNPRNEIFRPYRWKKPVLVGA